MALAKHGGELALSSSRTLCHYWSYQYGESHHHFICNSLFLYSFYLLCDFCTKFLNCCLLAILFWWICTSRKIFLTALWTINSV
jgi:hypothetical protein